MDYAFYYIQAHVACICLLCIIVLKIRKSINKELSLVCLGNLVIILALYFVAEIFWALVDGNIIESTRSMLYLSNIFTYILITFAAYYWFVVSEAIQRDKYIENSVTRRLIGVPVLISAILCITAFRTGFVFYVDENGVLTGGKYYAVLVIVPFGYLVASSIKAFHRYVNKDRYADRGIYFMIGIFPAAPMILGVLQAMYWRIPFLCYGSTAAVFYVYITYIENLVSIDPLTQANNRNQMYKYLINKMKHEEHGLSLFLMMVDVDGLRNINENYGHAEGDRALIRVSNAIKEACQGTRSRMFVSRYGGDEFVIVAEMGYRAEAAWLVDQIRTNIKRATEIEGASYDIGVSVGISQYDYQAPISLQAFIARADSDLYQNKKLHAG